MPAIRRNLICPESITIHVKNILATLTVGDVWSASIASCVHLVNDGDRDEEEDLDLRPRTVLLSRTLTGV